MSALPATRPTIRCNKCGLNQYLRTHRACVRCKMELWVIPEPVMPPDPRSVVLPPILCTLGERLRAIRRFLGLSQNDIGTRMHVPRQYICKVETNRLQPTPQQVIKIAAALDCNVEVLLPVTEDTALVEFMFELGKHVGDLSVFHMGFVLEEARVLCTQVVTQSG